MAKEKKIDLVIVKLDGYTNKGLILAVCPAYQTPSAGTEVVVYDPQFEKTDRATVVMDTTAVIPFKEEYDNIVKLMGATEPLPMIIKIIRYSEITWAKEDKDE